MPETEPVIIRTTDYTMEQLATAWNLATGREKKIIKQGIKKIKQLGGQDAYALRYPDQALDFYNRIRDLLTEHVFR